MAKPNFESWGRSSRRPKTAQWKTDVQFNEGSPTFDNVEVVGEGEDAYLGLTYVGDVQNDVPFTTPGDYDYDGDDIEVVAGVAKLKTSSSGSQDWPMTTPASYSFDSGKIEVASGIAKLLGDPLSVYGHWHMNESSGVNVPDSSGNARDGTAVNIEDGDWIAGKLNNGLDLDGTNEHIDFGDIASFERTDVFSAEAWMYLKETGSGYLFSKMSVSTTPNRGWGVYISSDTEIHVYVASDFGASNAIWVSVTGLSLLNVWKHIVVTYDGSSTAAGVKVYVDSVLQTDVDTMDGLTLTIVNADDFMIGKRDGASQASAHLEATVDEAVIYAKELSQGEITNRWNAGSGTEDPPGMYPLDDPDIYPNTGYVFATALNLFTEIATKPASTEIKYQISSDDGATWRSWSGSAWVEITAAQTDSWYYANEANTAAEVNTNIASLATSGTFRFRAFMHTSDSGATPELDNIEVAEGASYPTGGCEIAMNTDITPAACWNWLTATETVTKPANTDIAYQYSINGGVAWNGSWLTEAQLETAIQGVSCVGDGSDTIRFKMLLSTTDDQATPEMDNLEAVSSGGYATSGSYMCFGYTPVDPSADAWESLATSEVIPDGTGMEVFVRYGNHILDPAFAWANIKACGSCGIVSEKICWKVEMIGDGSTTPRLELFEAEYVVTR